MSLNDFRKSQGIPNSVGRNAQAGANLFLIVVAKVIQYTVLTLIGCLCWNYLAPLFNLPKLYFLRMLALIILSEVFFLRGTRR